MARQTTQATFPAATRSVTVAGTAVFLQHGQGAALELDVSAVTGTGPTLDVKLQAYDSLAASWNDVADSAGNAVSFVQKTAAGHDRLTVFPGITAKLTATHRAYPLALPSVVRGHATLAAAGGTDEVQTLTMTAGATGDTFKFTWGGVESSAITIPATGYASLTTALIQAGFNSIAGLATADRPVVTDGAGDTWVFTFSAGANAKTNVGAITVTSKVGAADGSFAETTAGVAINSATFSVGVVSI